MRVSWQAMLDSSTLVEHHFFSSLSVFHFNLWVLRLYHGASLFTGFVFFLTGAIELSEARRELAVKSEQDEECD